MKKTRCHLMDVRRRVAEHVSENEGRTPRADTNREAALSVDFARETVLSFRTRIAEHFGIPIPHQTIFFGNVPLDSAKNDLTLEKAGVHDKSASGEQNLFLCWRTNDSDSAADRNASEAAVSANRRNFQQMMHSVLSESLGRGAAISQEEALEAKTADLFERMKQGKHALCDVVELSNAALAAALRREDRATVRAELRKEHEAAAAARREQAATLARVAANPLDVDGQRLLLEEARQRQIQRAFERAHERVPESFGSVFMLYVRLTVNGVALNAFVDSGAQQSLITRRCASKCGMLEMLDGRFAGVARGVGLSKILGRIHVVPVQMGEYEFECSITVLERGSIEFLLGLDLLRRHQCCIDLGTNCLQVGRSRLPFLAEGDVRAAEALAAEEDEKARATGLGGALGTAHPAPGAGAAVAVGGAAHTTASRAQCEIREEKLKHLMGLGFSRALCEAALDNADGNADVAASLLLAANDS